jgi:outer membrane protein OmpA-like peptidoglycan-associated protein
MMSLFLRNSARFASIAAFALVAGCAQQSPPRAAAVVPYNPPGTALAALPTGNVTWYHVTFANNSYLIDPAGQQVINTAASSMQNNTSLTATLIGKSDSVGGGDRSNMRLSQQRAAAVRTALLNTGMVPAQQIETRWTGDRQQNGQTTTDVADASNRAVDIGVH